jgi:heterodisulfide reductase subunit D
MQDADLIVAECRDLIARHTRDAETARDVVVKAMLGDQPLPLKGGSRRIELSPRDVPPA